MSSRKENPNIALLKRDLAAGRINRREFLRYAVLVGMAAPAAYAFVGEPLGTGRAAARRDAPRRHVSASARR